MKTKQATKQWTDNVTKALKNKGEKNGGYDVSLSNKTLPSKYLPNTRPDVVWQKGRRLRYLFELDQHGSNYQKTIYGSMLRGLILAQEFDLHFVQVIPNDERHAMKIQQTLQAFKKLFHFKKADVLAIPRRAGHYSYDNIQWEVLKGLRQLRIVK